MRGCFDGSSQRSSATRSSAGIETQPAVAAPVDTCRKIALPRPGSACVVVRDHGAVGVRRDLVHGLGRPPGVFDPRVDPLVVPRAGRVVVPHDRGVGDLSVRELHPRIRLHAEEEVEPERSRGRSTVAFRLRVRRCKAVGTDVGVPGSERELPLGTNAFVGAQGRRRLPVVVRGDDDHLIGVARFRELGGHRRRGGRNRWCGRVRYPRRSPVVRRRSPMVPGRRTGSPCPRPPRSRWVPPLRSSAAPSARSSVARRRWWASTSKCRSGLRRRRSPTTFCRRVPRATRTVAIAASATNPASTAIATRRRVCLRDVRLRLVGSIRCRYRTSIVAATARRGSTERLTRLAALAAVTALASFGCSTSGTSAAHRAPGSTTPATTRATPTTAATLPPTTTTTTPAFVSTVAPVSATTLGGTYHDGCPVGPDHAPPRAADVLGIRPPATRRHASSSAPAWSRTCRPSSRPCSPADSRSVRWSPKQPSGGVTRRRWRPTTPRASTAATPSPRDLRSGRCTPTAKRSTSIPVENPYVEGGTVQPDAGSAYLDRAVARPGMAVADGPLVAAFAAVGWQWGGRWTDAPDYQHFSKSGG